jgi:phosphoribosylamine--glycine ligase
MDQNLSVMIIGGGAREHAISCAYEKSPRVTKIIVTPGNDFITHNRKKEVIIDKNCSLKDPQSFLKLAQKYHPDLVDVAQDDALASGTVDLLKENGFLVFGPTKKASRIEWDKTWSRKFMQKHQIPHPAFNYFNTEEEGIKYVRMLYKKEPEKIVYIKASGLCAGKGALKSTNLDEAIRNIQEMKNFSNEAGKTFVVEDALTGEEFSYYAVSDGKNYHIFKSAQDNKTIYNFDEGNQTGGMGAVSPAKVTSNISHKIEENLISKAINGMDLEEIPYKGILYLGGVTVNGNPMNIEYNARWGDPECQAVLPSVQTDYVSIVLACLEGKLNNIQIVHDKKVRVCIVGASKGYPNDYSSVKGKRIFGLEEAMEMDGITIFGSGIKIENGNFFADGGRLFSVVAEGKDILEARQKAYSAMAHISIEGNNLHYRTDIGWRDVERFLGAE